MATMISNPIQALKHESIDRLNTIVSDLPKYKKDLDKLIVHFTIDYMLSLINLIYKDNEFKSSIYYERYNKYFDEIEEFIHINI
jgi:hypothetical protein